jgi:hypothetical protein
MTGKRTIVCDLHPIMEEIRRSDGLPENLSTEAQLWDEIMKKETFLMPEQLFPLIKEIHGKDYPRTASIKPLATEYSVERMDTKEIASVRADITVLVEEKDIYHFECEMNKDGTMVIRMFEYDVHIAISYAGMDEKGIYQIRFPYSAVLYLQNNHTVPDSLACTVSFQDETTHTYQVPVLKVQSYTLEEIHKKHLCVLIPFLPLRFRKFLPDDGKKIPKGQLTDFYQQIILILEQEVEEGYLTENNRKTILSLLNKSMIRVFYKDQSLLEEVITMTEPILELEFEKIERLKKELIEERESKERELTALRESKGLELEALRESKGLELEALRESKGLELEALRESKEQELEELRELKKQELAAMRQEIERLKAELAKYQG